LTQTRRFLKGVLGVIATRDTELGFDVAAPGAPAVGPTASTRLGVALVGVMAAFVVTNAVMAALAADPFRWWANFITLPGFVLIALALTLVRAARETRFVLAWIGGIVLTTGLLLFAHSMGDLWPLMIIVPCFGPVSLFALRPTDPSVRAFVDTIAGLAVTAISLGVAFILVRGDMVDLGNHHWWAWFMLGAAAVPLLNGLILLAMRRGTYWFSMAVLLVALGGYTVLAGLAELNR
jgi:hypothetical protein